MSSINIWQLRDGTFELKSRGSLVVGEYRRSEKVETVASCWMRGLPRNKSVEELKRWSKSARVDVLIREGVPLSVKFLHRLPGGMEAVVAGCGVLSAGCGVLSAGNYARMAKRAAVAIRVAGQECRAVIERAEVAANKTIDNMHSRVVDVVGVASNEAKGVLTHNRREIERIVTAAGAEARYTGTALEIEMERLLSHTGNETVRIMNGAGAEVRETLREGNREAQETILMMSSQAREMIQEAAHSTNRAIVTSSREVERLITKAKMDVAAIIRVGAEECSAQVTRTVSNAIEAAERSVQRVQEGVEAGFSRLIEQVAREAKGIVLDIGDQGRLFIRDTGEEVRATANSVLVEAAGHGQILIGEFGEEMRLTVDRVGVVLHSTLYQVPLVAGLAGEQAARGVVHGIIDSIFGAGKLRELTHKINRQILSEQSKSIEDVLLFVRSQRLQPEELKQLYIALVNLFNDIRFEEREKFFLFIGVSALTDPALEAVSSSWIGSKGKLSYAQEVISNIPNGWASLLLEEHSERALEVAYRPRIEELPPVREIVFEEIEEVAVNWERRVIDLEAQIRQMQVEQEAAARWRAEQLAASEVREAGLRDEVVRLEEENAATSAQLANSQQEVDALQRRVRALEADVAILRYGR